MNINFPSENSTPETFDFGGEHNWGSDHESPDLDSINKDFSDVNKEIEKLIEELLQYAENQSNGNSPQPPEGGHESHNGGHKHGHAHKSGHGHESSGSHCKHHDSSSPHDTQTHHSHEPADSNPDDTTPVGGPTGKNTGTYNAGHNPQIDKWSNQIDKASKLTGLDPNLIGGQMWAESRGDSGSDINSKNIDGTTDLSLMQISQERWEHDVLPTLSAQDKANIKAATGKDASQLDMSNPDDNVIGGAFELRSHIVDAGGDVNNPMGNHDAVFKGLEAYVGVGDESKYANNVLTNEKVLQEGGKLDDNQ
ncbi:hypothetical protein [Trinickia fusca]|nr:hypothetical protein [Trinickia fusca]